MSRENVQLSSAHPKQPAGSQPAASQLAARLSINLRSPVLALVPGVVLAVAAGALAASRGFDGLYGQDAYAYFDYSTTSVRQSLLHLQPVEAFFWPPGYPLLVALTTLLLGVSPLAGQLVSLLAGAAIPVFTVLLARELWPDDVPLALVSGTLVALCGQLWQSSMVVMADTTGLALATFSVWAVVRFGRGHGGGWLVLASAAIAYATLSRWIYGLVALPLTAYAVIPMTQWRHVMTRAQGSRRLSSRSDTAAAPERTAPAKNLLYAALAIGVAAAIVLPFVGPSILGLLGDPSAPAAFAGNFQVYSWSPLNALRHDFFTADGHLQYALPNGVYYALAPVNPAFLGPVMALLIVAGLWTARSWPALTGLLVVGWAAIVYLFHAGAPWQNFRFMLAYLPPLAILAAAGMLQVWRVPDRRLQGVVLAATAASLLVSAGAAVRLVEGFIDRKDEELSLVRWVQAQTSDPSSHDVQLITFGPTLAFRHYSSLSTFDLFDLTPSDLDSLLRQPPTDYVLVDESSIQGQWLDQAPSKNFLRLRDDPGLTALGATQGYTLYRVDQTRR